MYQSLYRKYRPKNFNEVYGQDVAKKVLINSIKNNMLSHAYLFFGPRGTGKTSIAKMFARICNCQNPNDGCCCEKCDNCLDSINKNCVDIIEIDAASNNGVDEIRELKNKISLVPNKLKYKVYIIDEVHMLSIGAFNALLKTLEEPPEHIIFILATTEYYKVPSTIISRCQTIEFKNIDNLSMFNRLKEVSKLEKIKINDDAINEIVKNSNGGLRDALGLLDKLKSYVDIDHSIEINDVKNMLGIVNDDEIENICKKILEGNIFELFDLVDNFSNVGKDLLKIYNNVINYFVNLALSDSSNDYLNVLKILNNYSLDMKKSDNIKLLIKISFLDVIDKSNSNKRSVCEPAPKIQNLDQNKISLKEKKEVIKNNNLIIDQIDKIKNVRINNTFSCANKECLNKVKLEWNKLKEYVFDSEFGALVCDLLDLNVVVAGDKNLILSTDYNSIVDKVNNNIIEYEKLIKKILSFDQKIICVSNDEWIKLKNDYLQKVKNGGKFVYIEENFNSLNENFSNEVDVSTELNIIDKAKNLFGDAFN